MRWGEDPEEGPGLALSLLVHLTLGQLLAFLTKSPHTQKELQQQGQGHSGLPIIHYQTLEFPPSFLPIAPCRTFLSLPPGAGGSGGRGDVLGKHPGQWEIRQLGHPGRQMARTLDLGEVEDIRDMEQNSQRWEG